MRSEVSKKKMTSDEVWDKMKELYHVGDFDSLCTQARHLEAGMYTGLDDPPNITPNASFNRMLCTGLCVEIMRGTTKFDDETLVMLKWAKESK